MQTPLAVRRQVMGEHHHKSGRYPAPLFALCQILADKKQKQHRTILQFLLQRTDIHQTPGTTFHQLL